jgi:hypothetical protein
VTADSPIRSRAQHAMLTRVTTDAAYAAERGISAEAARAMLDAHDKAGGPELPERAVTVRGGRQSGKTLATRKHKLLGAH